MPFPSLLLFCVCLLVSFLYSGIEAGLLSLSRRRLRSRVHRGERSAIRLDRLLAHPGHLLATVLLVTNFADVAALVLLTNAFVEHFGARGYAYAGALMLPLYLLGLQLLPKALFRRFPFRALVALAGLLEITSRILSPILFVGHWLARRNLLAAFPGREKPAPLVTREEFKPLAAEGERTGALTAVERGMIDNVLDFNALPARDTMLPFPEAYRLPPDAPDTPGRRVADLLSFARARHIDHLPVLDAKGELLALLDTFALLLERDPQRDAAAYLRRPPIFLAPEDPALRVLRRLRAVRLNAAVVRDAEGKLAGVIRTRDLLQRLVRPQAA